MRTVNVWPDDDFPCVTIGRLHGYHTYGMGYGKTNAVSEASMERVADVCNQLADQGKGKLIVTGTGWLYTERKG